MQVSTAQKMIDEKFELMLGMIKPDDTTGFAHWSLKHAHDILMEGRLDLFEMAGLAKAIAVIQCED